MKSRATRNIQIEKQARRVLSKAGTAGGTGQSKPKKPTKRATPKK